MQLTIRSTRVLLALLLSFACFLALMDYTMYDRIQNYAVRPVTSEKLYKSQVPCDVDPFCVVTVKALMLGYSNLYIFSPLAAIVDRILGISTTWIWVTPNMISMFHVAVAMLAGHYTASGSLADRRLGVLLFQFRTWLDDLDGHVARRRKHIDGEHSDIGSTGYWIDGICDALGCVALMIGVFFFLKRNPPRGGYEKLHRIYPCIEAQEANSESIYTSRRFRALLRNVLLVTGHLLITSISWNRYMSLYQDLLETDDNVFPIAKDELYRRQSEVVRSSFFWFVTVTWRLINFHTAMEYLLIAIFLDRLWEYMRVLRWFGYIVTLAVVYLTEFHFLESYAYVVKGNAPFVARSFDVVASNDTLNG